MVRKHVKQTNKTTKKITSKTTKETNTTSKVQPIIKARKVTKSSKDIDMKKLRTQIQGKGLNKIAEYLDLQVDDLKKLNKEQISYLLQSAKIGMAFEREMNVQKRSEERNQLQVARIITSNKKELKKLIKRTMPQYN